jgi:hypothetical protein
MSALLGWWEFGFADGRSATSPLQTPNDKHSGQPSGESSLRQARLLTIQWDRAPLGVRFEATQTPPRGSRPSSSGSAARRESAANEVRRTVNRGRLQTQEMNRQTGDCRGSAPCEEHVYMAKCTLGKWEGNHCFGRLVAGPRYRFEIDAATKDVRFWSSDAPAIRGEYSNCQVTDGANWSCDPSAHSPTIAHQMVDGHPVADPQSQPEPLREIQKWRWLLLSIGIPAGHYAI